MPAMVPTIRNAAIASQRSSRPTRMGAPTASKPGNTISRRHAQIHHTDGQYFLTDLGSTNGTLLNSEALVGEEQLHDRDEIGVGIYKLIFRLT